MALPPSGPLSLSQIRDEFGGGNPVSLSQYYAGGGRVPSGTSGTYGPVPTSGAISIKNFYGTSSTFVATIGGSIANLHLATWASQNGWNGSSPARITIAPNVYIYSTDVNTPGLITGSFPNGLTIVNQGFIMGKGGHGGGPLTAYFPESGGPAISLNCSTVIDNTYGNAYIGGGGGGGGGADGGSNAMSGGGGAGGGDGGGGDANAGLAGPGGGPGQGGGNGTNGLFGGGGGGGRIFPGSGGGGGSASAKLTGGAGYGGGAGGGGAGAASADGPTFTGGTGGSSNGGGGAGSAPNANGGYGGGGGGWGASGGPGMWNGVGLGGAGGGRAVATNGQGISFVNGDTSRVWGAVG